jgi:hypothetical protein
MGAGRSLESRGSPRKLKDNPPMPRPTRPAPVNNGPAETRARVNHPPARTHADADHEPVGQR